MTTDLEAGRTETGMGRKQLAVLHPVHGYKIKPQQNLKTIKRNARERTRVENVNKSFESLRLQIPRAAAMGKLSKVSILAEAVDYIQYLHTLVNANNNLQQQSFHTGEVEEGYYSDVQMSPTSPQTWIPSQYSPQYSPQCSPDKDGYNLQTEEQQYKMHSHYSSEKQYRESVFHYNSSDGHSSSPPHSFKSSTLDYESWPKEDETKEDIVNSIVEWQH